MSAYKVLSIFQAFFILLVSYSVLDFGITDDLGFNSFMFDGFNNEYWDIIPFWAYGFAIVGLFQFIKAFSNKS